MCLYIDVSLVVDTQKRKRTRQNAMRLTEPSTLIPLDPTDHLDQIDYLEHLEELEHPEHLNHHI